MFSGKHSNMLLFSLVSVSEVDVPQFTSGRPTPSRLVSISSESEPLIPHAGPHAQTVGKTNKADRPSKLL